MQIMKFKDMNELIERANNTIYGLAASVFTKDIDKMNTIVSGVRAGTVWWVSFWYASVSLLIMNFVMTLYPPGDSRVDLQATLTMLWRKFIVNNITFVVDSYTPELQLDFPIARDILRCQFSIVHF